MSNGVIVPVSVAELFPYLYNIFKQHFSFHLGNSRPTPAAAPAAAAAPCPAAPAAQSAERGIRPTPGSKHFKMQTENFLVQNIFWYYL